MILVTGATGLLGSHLLFELVTKGKKVRAIRHRKGREEMVRKVFYYYTDDADRLFSQIEWVDAELTDLGSLEDAIGGVSEIYHAGAVVSFYPKDHKRMLKVNIQGTSNLVNLAMDKNVGKFCYISSVATLGRADHAGVLTEETYWVPSRKNSVYSISKYGAEREVWRGMEEGLNAVIVNPSFILGPGYWQDNSGLFRLVWEGLKYYTLGVGGYVDARDIAIAATGLMDNGIFGERFILSAEDLSYQEFFSLVAKYLNKPAPSVHVPPSLTGVAWRFEAVRSFLMRSKPEITKEMATITSEVYRYSNDKIRQRLGFRFRPVEESIREICGYYLQDLDGRN